MHGRKRAPAFPAKPRSALRQEDADEARTAKVKAGGRPTAYPARMAPTVADDDPGHGPAPWPTSSRQEVLAVVA